MIKIFNKLFMFIFYSIIKNIINQKTYNNKLVYKLILVYK